MKVICYGDSNTFGYDPRGYFGGRYDHGVLAERLGIRFTDAGQWNAPLSYDGVYMTEKGHRAFAEGIFNYLNKGE